MQSMKHEEGGADHQDDVSYHQQHNESLLMIMTVTNVIDIVNPI